MVIPIPQYRILQPFPVWKNWMSDCRFLQPKGSRFDFLAGCQKIGNDQFKIVVWVMRR
jgi:hypothetical protein